MSIILAILTLGIIIMIHELGHFTFAKAFKVKVLEFWIFMGPKICKWKRKETEYSLRILPIGGMCRMLGEEETDDDEGSYCRKSPLQRFFIIFGGPLFNIVFALLLLIGLFTFNGYYTTQIQEVSPDSPAYRAGIRSGDKLVSYDGHRIGHPMDYSLFSFLGEKSNHGDNIGATIDRNGNKETLNVVPEKRYLIGFTPVTKDDVAQLEIGSVAKDMPGEKVGLKAGDILQKYNGQQLVDYKQFRALLDQNKGEEITLTVLRDGAPQDFMLTPKQTISTDIGISFHQGRGNPIEIVSGASNYSVSILKNTYYTFISMFTGKISVREVSGPVGIVTAIGSAVNSGSNWVEGLILLFQMAALISISVGIFNLIPFPALDGCKLLFILFEMITRKKIKPEREALISFIGLAVLITFICIVTYFDISKLAG